MGRVIRPLACVERSTEGTACRDPRRGPGPLPLPDPRKTSVISRFLRGHALFITARAEATIMRMISALLLCLLAVSVVPVSAQTAGAAPAVSQVTTNGAVVSSTRTTLVVRTDAGDYKLFELNALTTRPAQIPVGATVSVSSSAADTADAPVAALVRVTAQPQQALQPKPADEPVPAQVKQLENSIKRQTARYRLGVRSGMALDPELVMIGAQGLLGPFFSDNVWARPNLELGFGEITDLIALNLEGVFRMPVTERGGRWSMFFGAGPAINFVKLGFAREGETVEEDIEYDEFDMQVGLNLLAGVQSRGGLFLELKSTVYAEPGMRFVFGYSF